MSLPEDFRLRALSWAQQSPVFAYYYDCHIAYPQQGFRHLLAVGVRREVPMRPGSHLPDLGAFHGQHLCWLFGMLGYGLKDELERLESRHPDFIGMPAAYFFEPEHLLACDAQGHWQVLHSSMPATQLMEAIAAAPLPTIPQEPQGLKMHARMQRADYLQKVRQIQDHITEGDVYELNLCMEFFSEEASIDPLSTFLQLSACSPMPFTAFMRLHDRYLLSASPERFLKKAGDELLSQPIKGTIRRGSTPQEDEQLREQLRHDEKEIAENMMIVDLVRNDLARSCRIGSVQVPELFGIYGFRQVHQMISSVSGRLHPEVPWSQSIAHAFPMGSMTGAPKVMSMRLIERYENAQRGLYSGAVGYVTPQADFDFNVVIRSIFYDQAQKRISFQVGSAITIDAQPEAEYDECLLKAQAILQVLGKLEA